METAKRIPRIKFEETVIDNQILDCSDRERFVITEWMKGKTLASIAEQIGSSCETPRLIRKRILKKLEDPSIIERIRKEAKKNEY